MGKAQMDGRKPQLSNLTAATRKELLSALCSQIDEAYREALRDGDASLDINESNRATMLRMLQMEDEAQRLEGSVDASSARELASSLEAYLDKYMVDRPQAHIWIILACLFSSFIAEEPMHPQGPAGWERLASGSYVCPAREDVPGSLCRWCVCEPVS
ncbi:MAG: DUF2115 family protein [Coriobacteriales bacterium]|nr:DUF2115 family protein [Coriobacteriales bacterium]